MRRWVNCGAMAAVIALLAISQASAAKQEPAITMAGNGGVCSLSARPHKDHTFKMKLAGWRPHSWVKIEVNYLDNGKEYPFQLRSDGLVRVDSRGSYTGHMWTCWPVGRGRYAVNDRKTAYFVYAFLIGIKKPLETAHATFRVVP